MKLIIDQADLKRALLTVSRAIKKSTFQITNGILIEARENQICLSATDLELSIQRVLLAEVIEPGQAVVGGKQLADIVKSLPNYQVEITGEPKRLLIKSKNINYELPVMTAEEFPVITRPSGESFTIRAEDFQTAIRQTIFATVPEDPRPFVSSMLLEINNNTLKLVATDVNRLAIKKVPIKGNVTQSVLVPVLGLKEIASAIMGEVQVTVGFGQIFFSCDGLIIGCRLVNAQYPDYQQIIPGDFNGSFTVNSRDFIKTLERSQIIDHGVKLSIAADQIVVSNKEQNAGVFNEKVSSEQTGSQIEIGFNVMYLLEFLKVIDEDKVAFNYIGETKPVVSVSTAGDYQYVAMPVRLVG